VLPDLDTEDLTGSLYTLLAERYGLVIDAAEQTLWGEAAEGATARRLEAPVHTPLLVFRRLSSAGGRPVEYVVSRYRGDRYQVHMSLGAEQGAARKKSTRRDRST
jgi:GntR family transcriptional regulator